MSENRQRGFWSPRHGVIGLATIAIVSIATVGLWLFMNRQDQQLVELRVRAPVGIVPSSQLWSIELPARYFDNSTLRKLPDNALGADWATLQLVVPIVELWPGIPAPRSPRDRNATLFLKHLHGMPDKVRTAVNFSFSSSVTECVQGVTRYSSTAKGTWFSELYVADNCPMTSSEAIFEHPKYVAECTPKRCRIATNYKKLFGLDIYIDKQTFLHAMEAKTVEPAIFENSKRHE